MFAFLGSILSIILPVLSIFLIFLILVQRGRGGGLVGAFGGAGGQSAFGAKAGDLFTRITVVTVAIWITTCVLLLLVMKQNTGNRDFSSGSSEPPLVSTPAGIDN